MKAEINILDRFSKKGDKLVEKKAKELSQQQEYLINLQSFTTEALMFLLKFTNGQMFIFQDEIHNFFDSLDLLQYGSA